MKIGRVVLWVLVPITSLLAITSVWATFHYGPFGKPSQSAIECSDLKSFILDEEVAGKAQWNLYQQEISKFKAASATERPAIVKNISLTLIEVLGHDLTIYREMQSHISCVKMDKRGQVPGLITETSSTINFLNGSEPLNGVFFNPDLGSWNVDFYKEYLSAIDFLKGIADSKSV